MEVVPNFGVLAEGDLVLALQGRVLFVRQLDAPARERIRKCFL